MMNFQRTFADYTPHGQSTKASDVRGNPYGHPGLDSWAQGWGAAIEEQISRWRADCIVAGLMTSENGPEADTFAVSINH